MVTYKLLSRGEKTMQYAYWPEGHEDKQPGIIVVDFELELIYLKKPAPEDWTANYKPDKPGSWHALVNEWRENKHQPPLAEHEWPTKKQSLCHYCYASYAMKQLMRFHKQGEMPEKGCNMWY